MAVTGAIGARREAVLRLAVLGPDGSNTEVEVVLDTGFTGHLTLPPKVVKELGLPLLGARETILADGSRVALDVHRAEVVWDGRKRPVPVLAARGGALAGMSLIWGHRLFLDAVAGGEVIIEPLSDR